ncbi:hypothetical protein PCANC_15358 [Puccinia coronata f. sp. avenae]|uniref:Uncharacterized protein n=1 Tax=Puccinia coronata f. sp. avenae TaxID=200324 RepID=A0A2N5SS40_9BASI|nr:hypothetical protein PCANC_15358 [Puccinia coronata f. sp. avenae]
MGTEEDLLSQPARGVVWPWSPTANDKKAPPAKQKPGHPRKMGVPVPPPVAGPKRGQGRPRKVPLADQAGATLSGPVASGCGSKDLASAEAGTPEVSPFPPPQSAFPQRQPMQRRHRRRWGSSC